MVTNTTTGSRKIHGTYVASALPGGSVSFDLTLLAHYEMEALGEASTLLNFNVNWMGATLPAEKKQGMMAGQAANFELFKHVCETNPA